MPSQHWVQTKGGTSQIFEARAQSKLSKLSPVDLEPIEYSKYAVELASSPGFLLDKNKNLQTRAYFELLGMQAH